MQKIIVLILILSISFVEDTFAQNDFRITAIKRKFKDNSEWTLVTNKGNGSLRNVYSGGNEWVAEIPGQGKFTLKQTFEGDPSEWRISKDQDELFFTLSFSGDYNEWRTGDEGKWVYVKTVFKNNFGEWKAEGDQGAVSIKSSFSDGSEWKITGDLKNESTLTKLSSAFIPLATYLFGKKR